MGYTKTNEAVFSNELLDTVIEHSFDGIYITDGQANTLKVNRSYLTISGLKVSEVLGVNMRELVKNGTISASGTLMAMEQKRPITIQQEFKTGKRALITSSPIFNNKNEIVLVITNVRDITELYHLKEEATHLKTDGNLLREELLRIRTSHRNQCSMVVEDSRTEKVLSMIDRVAPLDTTVILFGETGVGKEVFAKYIYQHSARKNKPFIKVNCGAIPANLVESELFGYEKGAFTGADKNGKIGLFELANTGTIFLDEVGELPLDMQVKLLRVLQEQEAQMPGKWKDCCDSLHVTSVSPYGDPLAVFAAAKEIPADTDLILLDCIGYTIEMKERIQALTQKPVLLSRTLVARVIRELV